MAGGTLTINQRMKRSTHHTAWAGTLAVAAELSRRGYDAALTLGNTPAFDLICASPKGTPFTMQVKSVTTESSVLIGKTLLAPEPKADLFFAVVVVPAKDDDPMEFRILTHQEMVEHWKEMPTVKKDGKPYKKFKEGVLWKMLKPYSGGWDKLPE